MKFQADRIQNSLFATGNYSLSLHRTDEDRFSLIPLFTELCLFFGEASTRGPVESWTNLMKLRLSLRYSLVRFLFLNAVPFFFTKGVVINCWSSSPDSPVYRTKSFDSSGGIVDAMNILWWAIPMIHGFCVWRFEFIFGIRFGIY